MEEKEKVEEEMKETEDGALFGRVLRRPMGHVIRAL